MMLPLSYPACMDHRANDAQAFGKVRVAMTSHATRVVGAPTRGGSSARNLSIHRSRRVRGAVTLPNAPPHVRGAEVICSFSLAVS
mmetsp:Transcript_25067/g.37576  ORF Transcript_25067/g.37576 Transcript_25067/m.37576 type:complete len:85 (-) Transcript_25067:3-257(-)